MAYDNTTELNVTTSPAASSAVTEGGRVSKTNLHSLTKAEAIVEFMKAALKDIILGEDYEETPKAILHCEAVPLLALEDVMEAWVDYLQGPGDPLFKFQFLIENLEDVKSGLEQVEKYFRVYLQQHKLLDVA